MKKVLRNILVMSLIAVLGIGVMACGKTSDKDENKPDFVYVPEYLTFPEEANLYNAVVKGNKIFYTSGSYDEAAGIYKENLNYMEIGVAEPTIIPTTYEENESTMVYNVDSEGNICLVSQIYSMDEASGTNNTTFKLQKIDIKGTVLFTQDISSVIANEDNPYIQYMAIDGENNIYLTNGDSKIWLFDSEGKSLGTVPLTEWINGISTTKEGKVVVCVYGTDGFVLKEIDIATKALGTTYDGIPSGNGSFLVAPGLESGVLFSSGNTLSQYDTATKTSTDLLNWIDCDINYNNISRIAILDDGRIVALTQTYSEESSTNDVILLTKTAASTVAEKTILTYGTLYSDSEVMQQIIDFNKTNETYRIEVKEYGTDDYETGVTQMNADIIAGTGPDIINISYGNSVNQYITKGVLADLKPLIEKDPEIKEENYLSNVLNAYTIDDKMYALIPAFTISTVMGKTSDVGPDMGWTVDDMMALVESKPEGTEVLEYATKSSMLSTMVMYGLDQYINWETGECSFNSPEFIKLLEFANTFESEANYDESAPSTPTKIQDGSLLLVQTSFSEVQGYQMYKLMFGEPVTFIGYPTTDGIGSSISAGGVTLAINSKTDEMDGAWEFLRAFLLEDYQNNISWYFPIMKSSLDAKLEEAMTPDYYTDENGKQVEQPKTTWGWNDFEAEIYAATQEEVDTLMSLINGVTSVSDYDQQMYTIISEEAEAFFSGSKTASEVAEIIQSRIQIYINESR